MGRRRLKVVSVMTDDSSNFAYENQECLKSVGIDCEAVKLNPHRFNYKNQAKILSIRDIENKIFEADIVQIMHTDSSFVEFISKHRKKCVVYHTGTLYRQNPDGANSVFNPIVSGTITDSGELMGKGAKNEVFIFGTINTDLVSCKINRIKNNPIAIAHYPSSESVKGTDIIFDTINKLKSEYPNQFVFNYSSDKVSHEEQLGRMRTCDIYIELFAPEQDGKIYGSFGVTAIEASALGKIVVTNLSTPDVYLKSYGCLPPFLTPKTKEELYASIQSMIIQEKDIIYLKRRETRAWVEKFHSYKSTGNKIKKYLLSI